jgi:hypothetical protein
MTMKALRSPSTPRSATHGGRRISGVLLAASAVALSLAATAFTATAFAATAEESVAAVFKARDINFFYRTVAAPFPCHELRGRVANILRAVGARDDIKVDVNGCDEFINPRDDLLTGRDPFDRSDPFDNPNDRFRDGRGSREQTAHVRIQLMSPVPVTPSVMAEIDRDKSRRELISRVTGNPSVGMNDPVVFPAQRQEVTLSRRSIRLEPEDCELLEQMSTSVFRQLDVRVVRRNFNCDARQPSRIAPQLTVQALLPSAADVQQPVIAPGTALPSEPAAASDPATIPSEPIAQPPSQ